MDDREIIELYYCRSERAVTEVSEKYGKYCRFIAENILRSELDSEECVNDALMRAWETIPPNRPNCLMTFLGKLTRNLALDKLRHMTAEKRGGKEVPLVLDELAEFIPSGENVEKAADDMALAEALNGFLEELKPQQRTIFMLRYWYMLPVKEVAERLGLSEGKVKMQLMRLRRRLREVLEKEGLL